MICKPFTRDGLAWREAGTGHSIMFLHGLPDSGSVWDGVIAELAPHYRCLAPDLPGFGGSTPPSRLTDLEEVREIMDAIVRTLALPDRFTLAVHDVGGLFGLAWAVARSERVRALIILNSSIFPDRRWHWGARILRTRAIGDIAIQLIPRRSFHAEMRRASNHNLTSEAIDATLRTFGPKARRTAVQLYRLQTPDLLRDLPEDVRALTGNLPALVIWGERDPYLPTEFAERFGAGTVQLHPKLGHWPHREAAAQTATEIAEFLAASALRAE